MPQFAFGPVAITFSGSFSGNPPTQVMGPDRTMFVVEHQIPAREGGIVEYIGSQQSRYQLKGFVSPSEDGPFNGTSMMILSGASYLPMNADDASRSLSQVRGSGANLLVIESTYSNESGYQRFYENGFFMVEKFTVAYEPGHTYPYYPYSLDLRGASPAMYGNSSGTTALTNPVPGGYFNGNIYVMFVNSGASKGETMNALGFYALTVASGNAKMALYNSNDTLLAQSASQPVHSGWNWFPLRPSSSTGSGVVVRIALKSDATGTSGWVLGSSDTGQAITAWNGVVSNQPYSNAFPASIAGYIDKSGIAPDFVMVAA